MGRFTPGKPLRTDWRDLILIPICQFGRELVAISFAESEQCLPLLAVQERSHFLPPLSSLPRAAGSVIQLNGFDYTVCQQHLTPECGFH